MQYSWTYPIYLIAHNGGYASIVDPQDDSQQLLVAVTTEEKALEFMQDFAILGAPRQLNNDREFAWLLESLQAPVTLVCFDPDPREAAVNAAWSTTVQSLLSDRLEVDYSPWSYPVYLLRLESGFSSIVGADAEGAEVVVLCLFSNSQLAEEYLAASGDSGTVESIDDMASARELMESLEAEIAAVAVDPEVRDSERVASHCIGLETLLNKYLIRA
ncbi:hypothetical protein [Blastopirellula marina]|uniref:Uncharacterized protein n=1 Tax=Blastopirellula marina DSM 3645 TaxID=314230 RepID=A3ZZ74_9BACT|nr:hypothetical protein [Blastopirellula marina]EAQ78204.1 hypothetical protein DSM3645_15545 [Blastopirellula marina DSM 3645]